MADREALFMITYHVAVVHKLANPVDSWRMNMEFGAHVLETWFSMDEAQASADRHAERHNEDLKTEWRYNPCNCGSDRCPGTDFSGDYVDVEWSIADLMSVHTLPDNVALHGYRSEGIRDGDLIVYPERVKGQRDTDDLRNSGKAFLLMEWGEDGSTTPILATDDSTEAWQRFRDLTTTSNESFHQEMGGTYDRIGSSEDGTRYGILRFRDRVWALEREQEAGTIG
jgi:hypothetical protein